VDGKPDDLPEDMAWYSAVRQVRPGIRLRVVIAMCERADVDIFPEDECRGIYEQAISLRPEAQKN
jgi:hypothetical protein